MSVKDFALDFGERGARRLHLDKNIHAIPTVLDHRRDSPHLTFDTPKARQLARMVRVVLLLV
jgi:hypothetical protein